MIPSKNAAKLFTTLAGAVMLAALAIVGKPAQAQEIIFDATVAMPPEIVVTTEPVYFGGVPCYWYGGRWVFRDHEGRWGYYRNEPRFLAERRVHAPPGRRYYYGGGYRGRPGPMVVHRR